MEVSRNFLEDQEYSTGYAWSITFVTDNWLDPVDLPQLEVLWHSDSVGDLCPADWGYPCVRLTDELMTNPTETFTIRMADTGGPWMQQTELQSSDKVPFPHIDRNHQIMRCL